MRQAQSSRMKSEQGSPQPNASLCTSSFPPLAHQTFLRHRGDQRPIALEYKPARVTARAVQVGRILRVKQPIVGAEWPVQPQRMIKTGSYEFLFEQCAPVWRQRGIEQHHIGCVCQYALMDGRKIRQLAGGANPDVELSAGNLLSEISLEFDRPQFDRPLALVIAPDRIRHHR